VTAADASAGTDVLRHRDLNDLSRTAVERPSNRSRIVAVTTAMRLRFDSTASCDFRESHGSRRKVR